MDAKATFNHTRSGHLQNTTWAYLHAGEKLYDMERLDDFCTRSIGFVPKVSETTALYNPKPKSLEWLFLLSLGKRAKLIHKKARRERDLLTSKQGIGARNLKGRVKSGHGWVVDLHCKNNYKE